jgi:hypothetical protein
MIQITTITDPIMLGLTIAMAIFTTLAIISFFNPDLIRTKKHREELKVIEIMKKELGESPTPDDFNAFAEKYPIYKHAIARMLIRAQEQRLFMNILKSMDDLMDDLLKKLKEDLDE